MDYFEKAMTLIVQEYINHYLTEYSKDPSRNWRSKDTALFLFSAIAIKSSTALGGVSSTNILVDVCEFWATNARQEFTERSSHPVLQADYIRYVYVFRNQVRLLVTELTVVDDGTTSSITTHSSHVFTIVGVCCVYLRSSYFGATPLVKTRGRTGLYEDGYCALIARSAGSAVQFNRKRFTSRETCRK